ncbi:MAG: hypothetical protein WC586_01075 [Methanoregula sp.]
MNSIRGEPAVSEVIGFILLLGILVAALVLYNTTVIPASGRESEIAQMTSVGEQFADYKLMQDGVWMSRLININSPTPAVDIDPVLTTTTLKLGSGGTTQSGYLSFPLLYPIPSDGTLLFNTSGDTLNIDSSSYHSSPDNKGEFPVNITSLEYSSNNYYWIQQRYSYQLGGVFLTQNEGTINRVSPLISMVNSDNRSVVINIVPVQIYGNGSLSSNGLAKLDTRQKSTAPYNISASSYHANTWVNISVSSADPATAAMWLQVFRGIAASEQLSASAYTAGTTYNPGTNRYISLISVTGTNPDPNIKDVTLYVSRVEFEAVISSTAPSSS